MKKSMLFYNHWRRGNRIKVFAPRTVAEVKAGVVGKNPHSSTECSCGGSCGMAGEKTSRSGGGGPSCR